jgi:hypothetical protein
LFWVKKTSQVRIPCLPKRFLQLFLDVYEMSSHGESLLYLHQEKSMPNWCTIQMTVRGPKADVERMLAFMRNAPEEADLKTPFDFNKLIPMPEELGLITKGSAQSHGLAIVEETSAERNFRNAVAFLAHSDPAFRQADGTPAPLTRSQALEALRASESSAAKDCLLQAERTLAARAKYGASDWYDWSVFHWGTKWNACNAQADQVFVDGDQASVGISFDTAWSFPTPIIVKFVETFNTLTVDLSADEEGGFFYVDAHAENGKIEFQEFEGHRPGGPYSDEGDD